MNNPAVRLLACALFLVYFYALLVSLSLYNMSEKETASQIRIRQLSFKCKYQKQQIDSCQRVIKQDSVIVLYWYNNNVNKSKYGSSRNN